MTQGCGMKPHIIHSHLLIQGHCHHHLRSISPLVDTHEPSQAECCRPLLHWLWKVCPVADLGGWSRHRQPPLQVIFCINRPLFARETQQHPVYVEIYNIDAVPIQNWPNLVLFTLFRMVCMLTFCRSHRRNVRWSCEQATGRRSQCRVSGGNNIGGPTHQ